MIPIKVTITIENIDELKYLCAITGFTKHYVNNECLPEFRFNNDNVDDISVFFDTLLDTLK